MNCLFWLIQYQIKAEKCRNKELVWNDGPDHKETRQVKHISRLLQRVCFIFLVLQLLNCEIAITIGRPIIINTIICSPKDST